MATGRQWYLRANANNGLRSSALTFVASMTVSFPLASRLVAMKCSTSKASWVAVWSFSSSDTSPRQKSEASTFVCLKCCLAKVDFPEPEGPIRTTKENSGMVSFILCLLA